MYDYEIMSLVHICVLTADYIVFDGFHSSAFPQPTRWCNYEFIIYRRYNTYRREIKRMAEKDEEQILIEFPCWNERKYDFAWFLSSVITIIFFPFFVFAFVVFIVISIFKYCYPRVWWIVHRVWCNVRKNRRVWVACVRLLTPWETVACALCSEKSHVNVSSLAKFSQEGSLEDYEILLWHVFKIERNSIKTYSIL